MEHWQLKQRQELPLEAKIIMSQKKIREFYDHYHGDVYVSFSGGKDSTVLLNLVREIYPDVHAVFVDTGLEYPEIREFVKSIDNVTWLRPKMPFPQVIEKYGYPVISKESARGISDLQNPTDNNKRSRYVRLNGQDNNRKSGKLPNKWLRLVNAPFKVSHKCCNIMKKNPLRGYRCFVGTMAVDSSLRKQQYLRDGCNSFSGKEQSMPMAFWTEDNVWEYLKDKDYCKIYDMGYDRTGCMFCMFGVHLEKGLNRFQRMQSTHPKQWDYCINKLGCGKVLDYIGVPYAKEDDLFQDMVDCNDANCR